MPTTGSLYVHLPLCSRKCDYCHFYVVPDKQIFRDKLVRGLASEWDLIKNNFEEKEIPSIYFGGGTPSLMPPEFFAQFLAKCIYPKAEITLEVNPETVSLEKMILFRQAGINRVSLGLQSLDDGELATLSRRHSSRAAIQAVQTCRQAGFENITIDLMYDTPGQTIASWKRTLAEAIQLPITHLSLYNLTFEPHTIFFKKKTRLEKLLPPEETTVVMYEMAQEMLDKAGLQQYEISAFCREGFAAKHNSGYWNGTPFWGMGPSAFSFWEGSRFRNISHLGKWFDAVQKGLSPVDFKEKLETEASFRERFVIRLRLLAGVKGPIPTSCRDEVERLLLEGFLQRSDERIALTQKGVLFYDRVAADLI